MNEENKAKPYCIFCKQEIKDFYYTVENKKECARCHYWLERKKKEEEDRKQA